jgi:hypothetical protein
MRDDHKRAMDPLDLYVLGWPRFGAGLQVISCLAALARDARGATHRNPDDGRPMADGPTPSWLGTMGYLVLLEQIGEAVHRPSRLIAQDGIPRALSHFLDDALPDSWVGALVGLRNSLAHDYGLVATSGEEARRHVYRLSADGPLVRLPPSPWDRDWHAHPEHDATHVNVIAVAELVEGVVDAVGNAWWDADLDTDLAGGRDELAARFLFAARA